MYIDKKMNSKLPNLAVKNKQETLVKYQSSKSLLLRKFRVNHHR